MPSQKQNKTVDTNSTNILFSLHETNIEKKISNGKFYFWLFLSRKMSFYIFLLDLFLLCSISLYISGAMEWKVRERNFPLMLGIANTLTHVSMLQGWFVWEKWTRARYSGIVQALCLSIVIKTHARFIWRNRFIIAKRRVQIISFHKRP